MSINHLKVAVALAASVTILSGCTSTGSDTPQLSFSQFSLPKFSFGPKVGETPADEPPKLVASGDRDKSGRDLFTWDRPEAFGKVPADKQVLGSATCLTARVDLEAIGYHPRAKDSNGRDLSGGGFLCAVKANGDKPSESHPRLARANGIWGWDNPSAFGAVPQEAKSRGDAICAKAGATLEAIGYHPQARNEQNAPIVGGGFFCAPRKSAG